MSDEKRLQAKAREALRAGRLPNTRPERIWGGPGIGAPCAVCKERIEPHQSELELQFSDQGQAAPVPGSERLGGQSEVANYHVHVQCFAAWEAERQQPHGLSRRSEEGMICSHECDATNGADA